MNSYNAALLPGNFRTMEPMSPSTGSRKRGSYREEEHLQGDLQQKLTKAFETQDYPCSIGAVLRAARRHG